MEREIICTIKDENGNITHVGVRNGGLFGRTILTEEEAIAEIESGRGSFVVNLSGHTVRVIVMAGLFGKHLQTEADST